MTVSSRDIYAAVALLIREHGSEAHSIAGNRAEELKAAGDEAGYAAFTRIAVVKHYIALVSAVPDIPEVIPTYLRKTNLLHWG